MATERYQPTTASSCMFETSLVAEIVEWLVANEEVPMPPTGKPFEVSGSATWALGKCKGAKPKAWLSLAMLSLAWNVLKPKMPFYRGRSHNLPIC